jgi:hypothetical protein
MTNEACKKLGVDNPLIQTASTATLLSNAKKNLRVDSDAGVGSIFYKTRTGGGHVGFVLEVDGNKITTIEGNTTPDGGGAEGVYKKIRDTAKEKFQFIHLEDLDTIENNLFAPLQFDLEMILYDPRSYFSTGVVLAGSLAVFYLLRKRRKNKNHGDSKSK